MDRGWFCAFVAALVFFTLCQTFSAHSFSEFYGFLTVHGCSFGGSKRWVLHCELGRPLPLWNYFPFSYLILQAFSFIHGLLVPLRIYQIVLLKSDQYWLRGFLSYMLRDFFLPSERKLKLNVFYYFIFNMFIYRKILGLKAESERQVPQANFLSTKF